MDEEDKKHFTEALKELDRAGVKYHVSFDPVIYYEDETEAVLGREVMKKHVLPWKAKVIRFADAVAPLMDYIRKWHSDDAHAGKRAVAIVDGQSAKFCITDMDVPFTAQPEKNRSPKQEVQPGS